MVKSEEGLDLENRAYYMTIAIQRWLGVRLDILGNILILGIGLFAAGFRKTVDPSKIGVVMSYTLSSEYTLLIDTHLYVADQDMGRAASYTDVLYVSLLAPVPCRTDTLTSHDGLDLRTERAELQRCRACPILHRIAKRRRRHHA